MAKKYIITKAQLNEYVKNKNTERVFYDILLELNKSKNFLNETISRNKVNQTIINNYKRKNLITPHIHEMLIKYNVINEKYEII